MAVTGILEPAIAAPVYLCDIYATYLEKGARSSIATTLYTEHMDDIHFERHFRTPYSEGYYIMQGNNLQSNNRLGTVDIHFTTTAVHGTLILERELEEADLTKLIEQIDEDLVLSADMPRDDFLVSVYVGKDVGFYSDEYFAEENNESLDFDDEDDPSI
ncbi:hypothetical protein KDK_44190 [Dictyobacter kobayashii]|uniref:Uncharacterized protein n=2 Tax=Dictyobacter kobayashii TaxID=2014872 RepID=A0A402ANL7_9CHLR|nr:hypothetical protein KDK_44190 [Dictyobacter kobayashii]